MRILLTGGTGMLGRALLRIAAQTAPDLELLAPPRAELDLTDRTALGAWYAAHPVEGVIHGAARVGGIQANIADPVGFLVENLRINDAVISGARAAGVPRLIFLGSTCMYPRDHRQPLVETDMLAAPLEPTNEGYALSKITGAKLCEYISRSDPGLAYRTLVPCNLFGEEDHFGSVASHLIAAVVTKVVDAIDEGQPTVEIWGSGQARREFLFVDDLARYILQAVRDPAPLPPMMNLGFGTDYSVAEYYRMVANIAGFTGDFTFDRSKPEGMMRKLSSSALAQAHGWQPATDMAEAIARCVAAYRAQKG